MKSDCHGPRLGPGPSVSWGRWSERSPLLQFENVIVTRAELPSQVWVSVPRERKARDRSSHLAALRCRRSGLLGPSRIQPPGRQQLGRDRRRRACRGETRRRVYSEGEPDRRHERGPRIPDGRAEAPGTLARPAHDRGRCVQNSRCDGGSVESKGRRLSQRTRARVRRG